MNSQRRVIRHTRSIGILVFIGLLLTACGGEGSSSNSGTTQPGLQGVSQGGSTARFVIAENFLYTISGASIQVIKLEEDLSDPRIFNPVIWNRVPVAWDIETLFVHQDALFIGSSTGVHIYDITRKASPKFSSVFTHLRSCDPVVVQAQIAYVTLRTTARCVGTLNQLDILDVRDLEAPKLIVSHPMQAPHGLGIDGPLLFICDGEAGLKVFNVTDPKNMLIEDHLSDRLCFDVIPRRQKKQLVTTGESGISQYDYTLRPMTLLSEIPLKGQ